MSQSVHTADTLVLCGYGNVTAVVKVVKPIASFNQRPGVKQKGHPPSHQAPAPKRSTRIVAVYFIQ